MTTSLDYTKLAIRDKAVLIGLYLSKFDDKALRALDLSSFTEAFNILGLSISVKPTSLKNYRDEFDPIFPNQRMGWHNRNTRQYCQDIYNNFGDKKFIEFTNIIKGILLDNYDIDLISQKTSKKDFSESVAKRLITGKSAEGYFKLNYKKILEFRDYNIKDTTNLACGFDYKVYNNEDNFYCVEVKGLNTKSGSISLTEKEYNIAENLKDSYCLFIVLNFIDKPFHKYYFNPLKKNLIFKKVERKVLQVSFITSI